MVELLSMLLYCWLLVVVGKLLFKTAWGITKMVAGLLFMLSIPALIGCLVLTSSLVLLLPAGLLVVAVLFLINA